MQRWSMDVDKAAQGIAAERDAAVAKLAATEAALSAERKRHREAVEQRDRALEAQRGATAEAIGQLRRRPRACVVAVVRRGDAVLLGRRLKNDDAHGRLVFPGGGVEPGEGYDDALARELREETGLELRSARLAFHFSHGALRDGLRGWHVCIAFECEADGDPRGGSDLGEPAFYPVERLGELDLSDVTRWLLIPKWRAAAAALALPLDREPALSPWWVSWYATKDSSGWELHTPWWFSGERGDGARTVCAAVVAGDEDEAKRIILAAYDRQPESLEWRICERRPPGWSPFSRIEVAYAHETQPWLAWTRPLTAEEDNEQGWLDLLSDESHHRGRERYQFVEARYRIDLVRRST